MANKPKKITEFCGDFMYKGECLNLLCDRIHTVDLAKMRAYTNNPRFKSQPCKENTACRHYMCMFTHTPDMAIMLWNGTPLFNCTSEQKNLILHDWNRDRHVVYLQEIAMGVRTKK